MAQTELSDTIHTALDNNEYVIGVFLDLSKAFNTISHKIFLSKLLEYGFRDNGWLSKNLLIRK